MEIKSVVKKHSVLFWVTLVWSLAELVIFVVYKLSFFYGGETWMGVYYLLGSLGAGSYNIRLQLFQFVVAISSFVYVVALSHKFTPDMKEILKGLAGAILAALAVHTVLFLSKTPFGVLDPIVYNGLAFVKIFIWYIAMLMCEKIKGL